MIIMEGVDSKSKNEAAKNTSERTYEKKPPEVIIILKDFRTEFTLMVCT